MRANHITVTDQETGQSRTFGPNEDLPSWAEKIIQKGNPDALLEVPEDEDEAATPGSGLTADDLIGVPGGDEDPLMKRTHDDLVMGASQWGAEGVSASNKKAELAAAIRAAGYEGDGTDLLDGE